MNNQIKNLGKSGMALPHVDDNTPREELDSWSKR